MANQAKSMHQIKQILEHLNRGSSISRIAGFLGMSRNTIKDYRDRFLLTGVSFQDLLSYSEQELQLLIRSKPVLLPGQNEKRLKDITPLIPYFIVELRKTGVTRQLLWQEYLKDFPDGYRYTRFCHILSSHQKEKDAVMRMIHLPGEMVQMDFAGDKLSYIDRETGEEVFCEVLVSAMPYSHFMHAVALPSQKQDILVEGMVKTLNYLKAVPHVIKLDNLKSAVTKPDRYTPEFTQAMDFLAEYYGTTINAARVAKPRDKASVESAVNICYMRIYAPLRHQQFYSLKELNEAILRQLEVHNNMLLQGKEYSRADKFYKDEYPFMKALPLEEYCQKKTTLSKTGKNYHVILGEDRHSYSVPYQLIGKQLKLIYNSDLVEVYDGFNRVALHKRSYRRHGYTTLKEHMPVNHQQWLKAGEYRAEDFLQEGRMIGPSALEVVEKMISKAHYVQHTYQLWHAFKRMKKIYGPSRLEAACMRLKELNSVSCRAIENVLKNGLDDGLKQPASPTYKRTHENLRGAQAYLSL